MIKKRKFLTSLLDNLKTILIALIIAIIIRSLIFQPFYIPSSSMEPTLVVGDRIFVSKYTYGYSRHSFPFSPKLFEQRLFYKKPAQGDLMVFKTPADNRTDYIKRIIGMPGDEIQFKDGNILINNNKIKRKKVDSYNFVRCGDVSFDTITYEETLPNGVKYLAAYNKLGTLQNSKKFIIPQNHFFLLGDNRDCSKDSRYPSVGFVNFVNFVGKAQIIFFSNDTKISSLVKFWNIHKSFRIERTFKRIN